MKETIESLLGKRILILDGAMGTMIQRHDLEEFDFREGAFENHNKMTQILLLVVNLSHPNFPLI